MYVANVVRFPPVKEFFLNRLTFDEVKADYTFFESPGINTSYIQTNGRKWKITKLTNFKPHS